MTIDDIDMQCPACGENVVYGDCRCAGGDLEQCGVERYVEFSEAGRARVSLRTQVRGAIAVKLAEGRAPLRDDQGGAWGLPKKSADRVRGA